MAYRPYAPNALDRRALAEKNRNAPDGMRYCNAICADYLPIDRFSSVHTICNQCRNLTGMADRKIRQNQLTAEQFIENPSIVYGEDKDVGTTRVCETCKQEKSFHLFEFGRRVCKSCRHLRASEHNKKKIEGYLRDIEELKSNIPMLENFCQHIPKDCLIIIISHYQIGRKATDPKSTMVFNIVQHFRALLDPGRCPQCGCTVVAPARVCGKCQEGGQEKAYERRQDFIDNLETTFENLRRLDPERDRDLYTKDQLCLLSRRAEIDFRQTIHKNDLFDLFNAFLQRRDQERERKAAEDELERKRNETPQFPELVVEQFRIQARASDGYINATQLCQVGGKRFNDWYRLENTKALCEALSSDAGISATKIIESTKGGNSQLQGSWIHPDLAVQLAQWISPAFGIRVSRWVREILTTGHTSLDPKSNEELILLQIELQREQEQRKRIETNHKHLLQKREYHKFQKGPCFYIIRASDDALKIGFDGVDINERFRTYRTSIPEMKVLYMIYSPRAQLIEENMLARYAEFRVETNHEFLKEISLLELTGTVDTLVNFFRLPSQPVPAEEIRQYNEG